LLLPRAANHDGTTAESSSSAVAKYDGPMNLDDVREGSQQLRNRLDNLQRSFTAAAPSESISFEPALASLRQRTDQLRHDLSSVAESTPDPVATAMDNLRRRLESLRLRVGHDPE
jgi:hypothetical protein